MFRNILVILISIIISIGGNSQSLVPKKCYLHLVGTINREFPVEMNLVKINDTIYGDYTFSKPGNVPPGKGNPGKGISFCGRMTSAEAFFLKEYNTTGAGTFTGRFENSQILSGVYSGAEGSKPMTFEVAEKYPEGSISMNAYFQKAVTPLVKKPKSPAASIQLVLLLPGESANPLISDSINRIILNTFTGKQVRTSDPVKVLEGMKQVYAENYIASNEAIYSEKMASSFNWQSLKFLHVLFNDAHILTFYIDHYAFTGGAHGLQTRQFSVVSLWTGREIGLKDVFKENSGTRLKELLTDKIHVMNRIPTSQSLKDAGFFTDTINPAENFYLTREGIGFYYNQYDIAPYASGAIDIFIPFAELKELLLTGGPVRELLR